jgi:hypothetical protein
MGMGIGDVSDRQTYPTARRRQIFLFFSADVALRLLSPKAATMQPPMTLMGHPAITGPHPQIRLE